MAKSATILSADIMSSFKEIVEQKNMNRIEEFLSERSVHQVDKFGDTFLHLAVKEGSVETAIRLCELGSNIYVLNKQKKSPLFYALKSSVFMVKVLLGSKEINDWSLLRQALIFGSDEVVTFFLNKLPSNINKDLTTDTIFNNTFEYFKITEFKNTEDIMKVLLHLQKYVNPEYIDYPLLIFFAAKTNNKKVLQLVLEDCEKYLEENTFYARPLYRRQNVCNGMEERYFPLELNIKGRFCETALHYAVSLQLPEVVLFLLREGADPNCKTRDDLTPLHYASYLGNEKICQLLLNYGAHVDPNSYRRSNPLYMICRDGDIRRLLQNSRGNVDSYLHRASNPLHLVCGERDTREILNFSWKYYCKELHDSHYIAEPVFNRKILKLLLSYGANPKIPGGNGFNPFYEACRNGRWKEMQIFLEFITNFHVYDDEGNTALHHATIVNASKTVDLILSKGINIDVKNALGYTPLMSMVICVKNPCSKMIETLVDRGANLSARSNEGWSVLQMAASFNKPETVLTLLELGTDQLWNLSPNSNNQGVVASSWTTAGQGLKVLLSFISLKEDKLGDFAKFYLKSSHINKASRFFDESKQEQEQLKRSIIINRRNISYYNILTWNFLRTVRVIKNAKLTNELNSDPHMTSNFPCYAPLIKRRLLRVESLENSVDDTIDFFLGNTPLPILVVDKILSYFSCRDFQVFGNVLSQIKN